MSNNEAKKWIGVVGRMLLAYALIFSQSALARQNQKATDKANAKQTSGPAQERRAPSGPNEGIKVHGHWTIEVRNPDGTVVTHREFENSLQPGGANLLGRYLSRAATVGHWEVDLASTTVQPCIGIASVGPQPCEIVEANSLIPTGGQIFATLMVSSGAAGFVLSGTAVAEQNGAIDTVHSSNTFCDATISLATCPGTAFAIRLIFTSANVNPAVNVSTGQTVAVTVTFTFA